MSMALIRRVLKALFIAWIGGRFFGVARVVPGFWLLDKVQVLDFG
jgi:hypothetical protein